MKLPAQDRNKVKDSIKINPKYIIDHAYLSIKPPNSSEHALHQDLHSLLQLLLPAQGTQELSSTCGDLKIGLLRISQGSNMSSLSS